MNLLNKGLITERLEDLERNPSQTICTEITRSKKRCFCMSVYRAPTWYLFFRGLLFPISKTIFLKSWKVWWDKVFTWFEKYKVLLYFCWSKLKLFIFHKLIFQKSREIFSFKKENLERKWFTFCFKGTKKS